MVKKFDLFKSDTVLFYFIYFIWTMHDIRQTYEVHSYLLARANFLQLLFIKMRVHLKEEQQNAL